MAKRIGKRAPELLTELRNRAGLSMEDLAKRAGYSAASGLQRYENPAHYKQEYFDVRLVHKLAPHLVGRGDPPIGEDELYLALAGVMPGNIRIAGIEFEGDTLLEAAFEAKNLRRVAIESREKDLPLKLPLRAIRVIGDVQAGVFREALEWPPVEQYDVMAEVNADASPYPVFGLKVIGPSMNQFFPEGSVAICIKLHDLPEDYQVRPGKFVVVMRRNDIGPDEFEATIKQIEVDPHGRWMLWPRSFDPAFRAPVPLAHLDRGADEDNDDVRLWAVVVGKHETYPL